MRKAGLTVEQHEIVGKKLKKIRSDIMELVIAFGIYPKAGKPGRTYRSLKKALEQIEEARSSAEDLLFSENKNAECNIYYGPTKR